MAWAWQRNFNWKTRIILSPGVAEVYDQHSYDREKREALNTWGARPFIRLTGSVGAVTSPNRTYGPESRTERDFRGALR